MPKALERKIRKEAEEKFAGIRNPTIREDRIDRYTFGALRNIGWRPKRERKHY